MIDAIDVLFVCTRLVSPETNGLAIRAANISRQLMLRGVRCHAVVDERDSETIEAVFGPDSFFSIHPMPAFAPTNWLRCLRLSDGGYRRRANPRVFERAVAEIRALAASLQADVAVSVSSDAAEYVKAIPGIARIADICDSPTLTLERLCAALPARSPTEAWSRQLDFLRLKRLERDICRAFARVTTISEADREAVARVADARDRHKLLAISNGVSQRYLSGPYGAPRHARAIAFWGNLDFQPNASAVLHFYEKVFVPFLAAEGIEWRIYGLNAAQNIRALPTRHAGVVLCGYAHDLARSLAGIPIMINPMTMGAGQKNKVLEAFALGLTVVSTRVGMSGIDAVDGEHFLEADDPADFAAAIRLLLHVPEKRSFLAANARKLVLARYSWDSIGERWRQLVLDLAGREAAKA